MAWSSADVCCHHIGSTDVCYQTMADVCCWQIMGDFRKTTDEGERLLLAPV